MFAPAGEVCSAGPEWVPRGRERRDGRVRREERSIGRRKWVVRTLEGGKGQEGRTEVNPARKGPQS